MDNRSQNNLSSLKNKPLKLLWNIGPHLVCIIDKNIVEKLQIQEGNICQQFITNDGDILLRIKRN